MRKRSNCLIYALRQFRIEGGYLCLGFVDGLPRFYRAYAIKGEYRRPIHRHRVPWNILWHTGRIEQQNDDFDSSPFRVTRVEKLSDVRTTKDNCIIKNQEILHEPVEGSSSIGTNRGT